MSRNKNLTQRELTEREQEIYDAVVNYGEDLKTLSKRFKLTQGTVRNYLVNIFLNLRLVLKKN